MAAKAPSEGELLSKIEEGGTANDHAALASFYRDQAKAAGMDEAQYCLADAQRPVQRMLDELLTPLPARTRVDWTPYFWSYLPGYFSNRIRIVSFFQIYSAALLCLDLIL